VPRLEAQRAELLALAKSDASRFLSAWDDMAGKYPLAVADLAGLRLRALHRAGRGEEAREWAQSRINGIMMQGDGTAMLDLAEAQLEAMSASGGKHSPADLSLVRHLSSLADSLTKGSSAAAKAALAESWYLAEAFAHAITEIDHAIKLATDPKDVSRYQSLRRKYESVQRRLERPRRR
jgi:hypothetical protein